MLETRNEIADLLGRSTLGRAFLLEDCARREGERKRLATRRTAVEAERDRSLPPLRAAAEKAKADMQALQAKLSDAQRKAAAAEGALFNASIAYDNQIAQIDARMRELSDPAIEDFISTCRSDLEATRRAFRSKKVVYGRLDLFTLRKPEVNLTNGPAVHARVTALCNAIQRAEELRTIAGVNAELELAVLRKSILPMGTLNTFEEASS